MIITEAFCPKKAEVDSSNYKDYYTPNRKVLIFFLFA